MIPVGCGVFLYYLLIYVKQNAGILAASDGSVDIVQKYSQILKSMLFNQTMMVMIGHLRGGHHRGVSHTQAVHGLRMGGCHCGRSRGGASGIFVGDFVFGVSVPVGQMILGLVLSAAIAAVSIFLSCLWIIPGPNMCSSRTMIIIIM